ncbi:MAG: SIMPL domain-containing protein [Paracoccaceae bacterium]
MKLVLATIMSMWIMAIPAMAGDGSKITVTGQGRVEVVPDMATISIGVTTDAKTSAEALSGNSAAVSQVLAQVKAAGIEPRDIQTSGLSLSPVWRKSNASSEVSRKIVGFAVNNQITVRVRELSGLGDILDVVVQNGANRFHGLSFGVQTPRPLEDEARQLAVADALTKAKLYAGAAGVSLGDILEINENGVSGYRPVAARAVMMSEPVPIAEGEISISASVTMVFEIND